MFLFGTLREIKTNNPKIDMPGYQVLIRLHLRDTKNL